MLITKNNSWESGVRKRTLVPEVKVGPLTLKFATIALLAIAALFYIAQSSQGSAQKYELMQIQESKKELQAKSSELEVEAARLKSLNEIKKNAEGQGFEPAGDMIYYKEKSQTK